MLSLYEILKASKTGIAPDLWTALAAKNWTGTDVKETTGELPLIIKTNGAPLLDYRIDGNMVQNGTPMPDLPILPMECGKQTKNLLDLKQLRNAPPDYFYMIDCPHVLTINLKPYTHYTLSSDGFGDSRLTPADIYRSIYFNSVDGSFSVNESNPVTVLTDNTGIVKIAFFSERTNAHQYLFGEANLWLNEGSTALPYESYGYIIPFLSNSQTTNIYLGEFPTTRRIKKIILNGKENWSTTAASDGRNSFILILNNALDADTSHVTSICTHIPLLPSGGTYTTDNGYTITKSELYMRLTSTYNSLSDFKSYLAQQYAAGTPVCVWYVLKEPTTGIVNEPLRKIRDYADTVSMEQAQVQIPTNKGNTVIDVETTLKPSEMYIKYQG